ncbi:MAG: DUF3568 family protein [Cephaloticoccus sp.]
MNQPNRSLSRVIRLLAGLMLAGSALAYSGCVAVVAAGAAGTGVAWCNGRMETTVNASIDDVYAASCSAVSDMEFASVSNKKSALDAELIARTALDKRVEIELKKVNDNVTEVSIRVGIFGDETVSLAILDKIKSRL